MANGAGKRKFIIKLLIGVAILFILLQAGVSLYLRSHRETTLRHANELASKKVEALNMADKKSRDYWLGEPEVMIKPRPVTECRYNGKDKINWCCQYRKEKKVCWYHYGNDLIFVTRNGILKLTEGR